MRNRFNELSNDELLETDGGIIPGVVVAIKVLGGGLIAGACWRAGEYAYDKVKEVVK